MKLGPSSGPEALQPAAVDIGRLRFEAAQMERIDSQVRTAAGAVDKARAQAAAAGPEAGEMARLQKVSREFESVFLAYLMKTMRQAVPKGELFGDSQAEQIFSEMRDDELAKNMAQAGGIGLSRLLVEQLKHSLGPRAPLAPGLPAVAPASLDRKA